jgi:hypothetical protein
MDNVDAVILQPYIPLPANLVDNMTVKLNLAARESIKKTLETDAIFKDVGPVADDGTCEATTAQSRPAKRCRVTVSVVFEVLD